MVLPMDLRKSESVRSVAQPKSAPPTEEIIRPPLVPSEKNNAAPGVRKPRVREITSRYKSGIVPTAHSFSTPTAPRRCPSPSGPRTTSVPGAAVPKRAQSAERRRPSTPSSRSSAPSSPSSRPSTPSSPPSRSTTPIRDSGVDTHISSRRLVAPRSTDGLWPSMRSLSSSFQSESISVPTSKRERPVTSTNSAADQALKCSANVLTERKKTPLRARKASDQSENSKPVENSQPRAVDQQRWPGIAAARLPASSMSRSMDLTSSSSISSRGVSPRRRMPVSDVPGRVLQKSTSDGNRRMSLDGIAKADSDIASGPSVSSIHSERASLLTRPSRTQSMPIPSAHRPSLPSRVSLPSTASSRGMPSPSRTRPSTPFSSSAATPSVSSSRGLSSPSRTRPSTPFSSSTVTTGRTGISSSVLSYIVDARKGKKNANQIEDVHQLRLLYNRYLQWRFVNARAETALFIQKVGSENLLYNVWLTTSELHDSVFSKKIEMQHLKQELKLDSILKEQMAYLEDWASLERDHSSSLSGAIEALKASTVRLPVTGGARADAHALKDATGSAVDVMRAMGSSVCYLLSRAEGTNSLVSELANVAAQERALLDECRELLASTAAMQVQESSLRTQLLQLSQDMEMAASGT